MSGAGADADADADAASRRATVLARVRRALNRSDPESTVIGVDAHARTARDRMAHPRANTIPMRAQLQQPQLGELFEEMLGVASATCARVSDVSEVPNAVARWCAEQAVTASIVVAPESPLAALEWAETEVDVQRRPIRSGDAVSLATAAAGVAETGTLVLTSGAENPVSANFLPDNQVIVVRMSDVMGTPEDCWMRLREQGSLPRTVNWITGPSRSGDIEMKMLMGAHGPIRLHVVIVED